MKPFTITYFWDKKKPKIDILILLPHAGNWEDWINQIHISWIWDKLIDWNILREYLAHEADRWSREIISESICLLKEKIDIETCKIAVFDIHIPRWICDLNRVWERACPWSIRSSDWKSLYDETLSSLSWEIDNASFCLQFHTMNGKDPTYKFSLDWEKDTKDIQNFLNTCYSGKKRECNILTRLDTGEYITSQRHDQLLQSIFQSRNIKLHENEAYRFTKNYPATDIAQRMPSTLIEITKDSLANSHNQSEVNSSKIIFDQEKIHTFAEIFSDFFVWLLLKTP